MSIDLDTKPQSIYGNVIRHDTPLTVSSPSPCRSGARPQGPVTSLPCQSATLKQKRPHVYRVQALRLRDGAPAWIVLDGRGVDVKSVTGYLSDLHACHRSPNTIRAYAFALARFCQYMEGCQIPLLALPGADYVRVLLNFKRQEEAHKIVRRSREMASGHQLFNVDVATVKLEFSAIFGLYEFLIETGECLAMPGLEPRARQGRVPGLLSEMFSCRHTLGRIAVFHFRSTHKRRRPRVVPNDVLKAMMQRLSDRDLLLVYLLRFSGLRLGEALGLRLTDIDIPNKAIYVRWRDDNLNFARAKYGEEESRGYPEEPRTWMPDFAVRVLCRYLQHRGTYAAKRSEYLFINLHGPNVGFPLRAGTVEKSFERASESLAMQVTPHMLRHTFATRLMELCPNDIAVLQRLLNHQSILTTSQYIHVAVESLRKALDMVAKDMLECGLESSRIVDMNAPSQSL